MKDAVFHGGQRHYHISLWQRRCWRSCPKTPSTSCSRGRLICPLHL